MWPLGIGAYYEGIASRKGSLNVPCLNICLVYLTIVNETGHVRERTAFDSVFPCAELNLTRQTSHETYHSQAS